MMKDDFLQCFKMFETIYQAYLADSSNPDASPLYLMDCLLNLSTRLGDTSSFFKYALAQYDILSKMNDVPQEYFIECQNSIVVGQLRCRQLDGIDDMLNKIESFYREQYGEFPISMLLIYITEDMPTNYKTNWTKLKQHC